jgi:hypothetical protein
VRETNLEHDSGTDVSRKQEAELLAATLLQYTGCGVRVKAVQPPSDYTLEGGVPASDWTISGAGRGAKSVEIERFGGRIARGRGYRKA